MYSDVYLNHFVQLPATVRPGVTVVISPLLSLIQDQIVTLNLKFGIPSTFMNSQQTASQAAAVLQELRQVLSCHSINLRYFSISRFGLYSFFFNELPNAITICFLLDAKIRDVFLLVPHIPLIIYMFTLPNN